MYRAPLVFVFLGLAGLLGAVANLCGSVGELSATGAAEKDRPPATSGTASGAAARESQIVRPVYANDFQKNIGPEWSHRRTDVTPKGGRSFLGQFGNDEVRLTLKHLPDHEYLRVSFELFIIHSWDGDSAQPGVGPDLWSLKVEDGRRLLHAAFTEHPMAPSGRQTFPDDYPGPTHPRRTGAAEKTTLGYTFPDNPDTHDAVYRVGFAFPHTAVDVTLMFSGSGLQELTNESWGLDNVKVAVLPGPQRLSDEQLEQHWRALRGDDPVKAFQAYWAMMATAAQAADFLAERARKTDVDQAKARRLIAQLDADKWRRRETAQQRLRSMGPDVAPILREALKPKANVGPEVTARIELLLKGLSSASCRAKIRSRYLRIIRLLEAGRTQKALAALAWLARRAPTDEIQHLARAALRRLETGGQTPENGRKQGYNRGTKVGGAPPRYGVFREVLWSRRIGEPTIHFTHGFTSG